MAKVGYKEYLQSLEWRYKRISMIQNKDAKCYCCNAEKWQYRIYKCNFCGNKFYGDKWNYFPDCDCGNEIGFEAITDGSEYFQLHHLTYKNFGHEKEEDLIVICEDCHKLLHNLIRLYPDLSIKNAPDYLKEEKNLIRGVSL